MLFSPDHVAVIIWVMDFVSMALLPVDIVALLVDLEISATTVAGR